MSKTSRSALDDPEALIQARPRWQEPLMLERKMLAAQGKRPQPNAHPHANGVEKRRLITRATWAQKYRLRPQLNPSNPRQVFANARARVLRPPVLLRG